MKKLLSALFVCGFALVLTGCGKGNDLKCTATEDGNKVETTISFKNDKPSKVVEKMTFESEEYAQMVYAFAGLAGDNYKASQKGKTVTITATGDAITDLLGEATTKEDAKKALEAQGYTCK